MSITRLRPLPVIFATAILSACGGSGTKVASVSTSAAPSAPTATPTPTPTPTTTPTSSGYPVTIFDAPVVGEFASLGTSVEGSHSGGDGFDDLSAADSDQPHIRYLANGTYEISMPGAGWSRLVIPNGDVPQDADNWNLYAPANNQIAYFVIEQARHSGYEYSELASWGDTGRVGATAFGVPTPAGQVPVTGTASYEGIVQGTSDVIATNWFDGPHHVPIGGTVKLDFDFAHALLDGSVTLVLNDYTVIPIGTFKFADTVYSAGSTTYSGKFAGAAAGDNYFLGRFTGPNAEETIGAWALPFVFSHGSANLPADNQVHQAFGAWIAKKGH